MNLDEFAKSFITLGLRINRHIDGYVDHYYGPPDLKEAVDTELIISPNKLFQDSIVLLDQLEDQDLRRNVRNF